MRKNLDHFPKFDNEPHPEKDFQRLQNIIDSLTLFAVLKGAKPGKTNLPIEVKEGIFYGYENVSIQLLPDSLILITEEIARKQDDIAEGGDRESEFDDFFARLTEQAEQGPQGVIIKREQKTYTFHLSAGTTHLKEAIEEETPDGDMEWMPEVKRSFDKNQSREVIAKLLNINTHDILRELRFAQEELLGSSKDYITDGVSKLDRVSRYSKENMETAIAFILPKLYEATKKSHLENDFFSVEAHQQRRLHEDLELIPELKVHSYTSEKTKTWQLKHLAIRIDAETVVDLPHFPLPLEMHIPDPSQSGGLFSKSDLDKKKQFGKQVDLWEQSVQKRYPEAKLEKLRQEFFTDIVELARTPSAPLRGKIESLNIDPENRTFSLQSIIRIQDDDGSIETSAFSITEKNLTRDHDEITLITTLTALFDWKLRF